jgi:hypothetical protein
VATVNEAASQLSQGNSDTAALRVLSLDQVIPFTQYIRYVLPLDGYVFWLRTMTQGIQGSLHVTIDKRQNEDETIAINRVMFSTGSPVQAFNAMGPDKIWVGESCGQKFAFTASDNFYEAAGLHHYLGNAVYPALASQLIDVGEQLPTTTLIVSNSLPLWLSLRSYTPEWSQPPNPLLTLYPSYLVPDNLQPPYGVVHIEPNGTRQLQATPLLGPVRPVGEAAMGTVNGTTLDTTHWQLVADRVRVTLYGATNQVALDFLDLVNRYSYDLDLMGIMSSSPMRDEKRTQAELGILAMKKVVEYDVSYYQARVNTAARQLIETAVITTIPNSVI